MTLFDDSITIEVGDASDGNLLYALQQLKAVPPGSLTPFQIALFATANGAAKSDLSNTAARAWWVDASAAPYNVGRGVNADDGVKLQAAIILAEALAATTEGPVGGVFLPPGCTPVLHTPIVTHNPSIIDWRCTLQFAGTGAVNAITIGGDPQIAGKNYGGKGYIAGLRCVGAAALAGLPTGINIAAPSGIVFENFQFSGFQIDNVQGFPNRGVGFDCSAAGAQTSRNVQDCDIELGQIAFNGVNIDYASLSGANSAGAFRLWVQNSFAGFRNLRTDYLSSSPWVHFNNMDACAPGGLAVEWNTVYGTFFANYLDGSNGAFQFGPNAQCNTAVVGNNYSTLAKFVDLNPGHGNRYRTGPVNPGVLPATIAVTPGQVYTNTYGVPIQVGMGVDLGPTASAPESASITTGPPNAQSQFTSCSVGAGMEAITFPITFRIEPGEAFTLQVSGSGSEVNTPATLRECML